MKRNACSMCGYDLSGVPDSGHAPVCPECGDCSTPLEVERRKWKRRRWVVPMIVAPTCAVGSLGLPLLLMFATNSGACVALAVILVFAAGPICGIIAAWTWIRSESLGYDRGRTAIGAIALGCVVGCVWGAITFAMALGIATVLLEYVFPNARFFA